MMSLLKSQLILLLSKKDMYILLTSLLIFLVFLLYSSKFYLDYNYLVVYKANLFRDYLTESITFMKFLAVLYGVYLSILVKKLHHLDGLYLSRSSRIRIITSRLVVLISCLAICITIMIVLFLTVGTFLTPIMGKYDYLSLYSSVLLFGVFYFLLSYIIMLSTQVFYAPIFTLFLYFTGTIFSPYYIDVKDATLLEEVMSFGFNDLIVFSNNMISPYYGNLHLCALIVMMFWIVVWIYHEKDIITF